MYMRDDEDGRIIDGSTINSTEFQDFEQLVDAILSKNIYRRLWVKSE
jgi:hypothetical protein